MHHFYHAVRNRLEFNRRKAYAEIALHLGNMAAQFSQIGPRLRAFVITNVNTRQNDLGKALPLQSINFFEYIF